jgi:glycosyltransferase involved in cell wall biosynthesis
MDCPSLSIGSFGIVLAEKRRPVTLKNHMCSQPIITVCIPAYNGEEFIAGTMENALNQTFTDFELMVENKSTEVKVSMVKTFNDRRIELMENERNSSLEGNVNKGLSCSRSESVKLLGDEGVPYPECLSRQVAALEHRANAGAAICNRNPNNWRDKAVMRRSRRCCMSSGVETPEP